ncbi:pectinesterase inhibitor domain-containing protein [Bacillus paralicheniformis]|uniref:plant invertase/pectin methylesterase inhibitor family protein n=1 Tax=Bacillus paralicheniformis TaxID=1648923 RepID=UPI0010AD2708|nr:pectinesterase inhibitor domain-containing protein [Bacillus paralicheniformis]
MSDSLDRVSKSIQELKSLDRVKGQDFIWHMSNVQTWVSSALTDENTCMDGFAGRAMEGRIKTSVRAQITNVAHVTSNALALVNHFAQNHQ